MSVKGPEGLLTLCETPLDPSEVYKEKLVEVVAVHGLCGHREDTWSFNTITDLGGENTDLPMQDSFSTNTMFGEGANYLITNVQVTGNYGGQDKLRVPSKAAGISWLRDFLPSYAPNVCVSTFGYNLQHDGISDADIQEQATCLLNALCAKILPNMSPRRTFVFIGHNIGGSIIKQMLLNAHSESKYSQIARSTSLVIFFGCPHRAIDPPSWEKLAHNLIYAAEQENSEPLSDILKRSAKTLNDINKNYEVLARIYNTISFFEYLPLVTLGGTVFDRYSSIMDIPNETIMCVNENHLNMCSILDTRNEAFTFICDNISQASNPDSDFMQCLTSLSSFNPTPKLSNGHLPHIPTPSWLVKNEVYNRFLETGGGAVLQLSGRPTSGLSTVASFLQTHLQKQEPSATIIGCSSNWSGAWQSRTSSLFASFILQLLFSDPLIFKYMRHIYRVNGPYQNWSTNDLWVMFRSAICHPQMGSVFCIIDEVNKYDPTENYFINDFLSLIESTSNKLKIIITNEGETNALKLPNGFTIHIDELESRQVDMENFISDMAEQLGQSRPGFSKLMKSLKEEILISKPSFGFVSLTFKWIQESQAQSTRSVLQNEISLRPHSLSEIYKRRYIPDDKANGKWLLEALYWIVHACRPLKVRELAAVLALEPLKKNFIPLDDNTPLDLPGDLKLLLSDWVKIENEEVFLIHDTARVYLRESADEWYPQPIPPTVSDSNNTEVSSIDQGPSSSSQNELVDQPIIEFSSHAHIASTCMNYLLSLKDEDYKRLPSTDSKLGLLSYAATFWHVHYKLATRTSLILQHTSDFIMNTDKTKLWAPFADMLMYEVLPESHRCSPPLVAAQFGLSGILIELLDKHQYDSHTCSLVLDIVASIGDSELVSLLIQRGHTIGEALHYAAGNGHLKVVRLLLEIKPDILNSRNSKGSTPLHIASRNGYYEVVDELLKHKSDVTIKDSNGCTPLHLAAQFGQVKSVQLLLNEKAETDALDTQHSTPLHLATLSGQLEVIELLVQSGADVHIQDHDNFTALELAAKHGLGSAVDVLINERLIGHEANSGYKRALLLALEGRHLDTITKLLNIGGDITPIDPDVGTPLHVAVRNGDLKVARLLMSRDKRIDPNLRDKHGRTALHLAALIGHTNLIIEIFTKETINLIDDTGATPLLLATTNRHLGAMEALIERTASVDIRDPEGTRPLIAAIRNCDAKAVKLLLHHGAATKQLRSPLSPLQEAAKCGQAEIIQALLDAGAGANEICTSQRTPLHYAAESGHIEAVKVLIDGGAHVNDVDKDGVTPLFTAVEKHLSAVVKLLIEKGASTNTRDKSKSTPLHNAAASDDTDTLKFILDVGKVEDVLTKDDEGQIPLHRAAEKGHVNSISLLLSKSAPEQLKSVSSKRKRTPLHLSAKAGHTEAAKTLLEFGAEIDLIDGKEQTALHLAVKKQHLDTTRFLLASGANIETIDYHHQTPLHRALEEGSIEIINLFPNVRDVSVKELDDGYYLNQASEHGKKDVVDLLLSLKVDVNTCNDEHRTPLSLAAGNGHIVIVQALLYAGADINIKDLQGRTAVYYAVWQGHLKIVEALLNARDKRQSGTTPLKAEEKRSEKNPLTFGSESLLYTAAYYGREDIVGELLQRHWDVNERGPNDWTPLHAAFDNAIIGKILLDKEAQVDAVSIDEETPLHLAAGSGFLEPVKLLLDFQADPLKITKNGDNALHLASLNGQVQILQLLLDKVIAGKSTDEEIIATCNVPNSKGHTPLWEAVSASNIDIVNLLLSKPYTDVNWTDYNGKTLLVHALEKGNEEIVNILLRHGAKKESYGDKILRLAAAQGHQALVQQCLSDGIDPNATDEHGWSAMLFAAAFRHNEVVSLLKDKMKDTSLQNTALLPSSWSQNDELDSIEVDGNGLSAKYKSPEANQGSNIFASLRANHPIPPSSEEFYFEITILNDSEEQRSEESSDSVVHQVSQPRVVSVGVCTEWESLDKLPGMSTSSWGYHSDGRKLHRQWWGSEKYGETYGKGDIVGCHLNIQNGKLSFFKNGEPLGPAFENVRGLLYPIVGIGHKTGRIKANFGAQDFICERFNGPTKHTNAVFPQDDRARQTVNRGSRDSSRSPQVVISPIEQPTRFRQSVGALDRDRELDAIQAEIRTIEAERQNLRQRELLRESYLDGRGVYQSPIVHYGHDDSSIAQPIIMRERQQSTPLRRPIVVYNSRDWEDPRRRTGRAVYNSRDYDDPRRRRTGRATYNSRDYDDPRRRPASDVTLRESEDRRRRYEGPVVIGRSPILSPAITVPRDVNSNEGAHVVMRDPPSSVVILNSEEEKGFNQIQQLRDDSLRGSIRREMDELERRRQEHAQLRLVDEEMLLRERAIRRRRTGELEESKTITEQEEPLPSRRPRSHFF